MRKLRKKDLPQVEVNFTSIAGGGQAVGKSADGKVVFAWNALPGETARVQLTKRKNSWAEGVAVETITPSADRIKPRDEASYLSTSPWQMMNFAAEQRTKSQLIADAFRLHHIDLPAPEIFTDEQQFSYRNKVEFSWWWTAETDQLDLAFYRRGSHTRQPVDGTSLAHEPLNKAARNIRDILRKMKIEGRALKSLIVRSQRDGQVVAALYCKIPELKIVEADLQKITNLKGLSVNFSDPRSPASVTTQQLQAWGDTTLSDEVLGTPYRYAVDGFFQVNLPLYEQSLRDMADWLTDAPLLDMYSGVGTIGLSLARQHNRAVTLIEENAACVREMQRNAEALQVDATIIHATSEQVLEHITSKNCVIVDPPRVGLHDDVVAKLLATLPPRIIYLSCNPVTQARDVEKLQAQYELSWSRGYNFFPRTPHIEHLLVLSLRKSD